MSIIGISCGLITRTKDARNVIGFVIYGIGDAMNAVPILAGPVRSIVGNAIFSLRRINQVALNMILPQ